MTDCTIGRALSSPLFTQEREDPASRRQAHHSLDESLLSSQPLSVGHVRTGRLDFDEFGSLISNVRENPRRSSENEQIRILLERQREQILADYRAEIQKHEFLADYDRKQIQKLNEVIKSQRGEIYRAHQEDEQHRRDQQLLHEQLLEQNRELREADERSLNEMEGLKRFQGSTFDKISTRRLIENRDTILELTGKTLAENNPLTDGLSFFLCKKTNDDRREHHQWNHRHRMSLNLNKLHCGTETDDALVKLTRLLLKVS